MQVPLHLSELERALARAAGLVLRFGEAYAPLLDARQSGATARARRVLEEFRARAAPPEPIRLAAELRLQSDAGAVKAIRSSHD